GPDTGIRRGVDREAVDPVHRAEQVVPRVRLEERVELVLPPAGIVDLEPELDRQAAALRLHDRVDVGVKVVNAALGLVRQLPERTGLPEVVDVLREADLVHRVLGRGFDERLDRVGRVRDSLLRVAQVHVVVDDHRRSSRSRPAASLGRSAFQTIPSTTTSAQPPRKNHRPTEADPSAPKAKASPTTIQAAPRSTTSSQSTRGAFSRLRSLRAVRTIQAIPTTPKAVPTTSKATCPALIPPPASFPRGRGRRRRSPSAAADRRRPRSRARRRPRRATRSRLPRTRRRRPRGAARRPETPAASAPRRGRPAAASRGRDRPRRA